MKKRSTLLNEVEKISDIKEAIREANFRVAARFAILVPKHLLEYENGIIIPKDKQVVKAKDRGDFEGYIVAVPPAECEIPVAEGDRVYFANADINLVPVMDQQIVIVDSAYFVAASNLKHLENGLFKTEVN